MVLGKIVKQPVEFQNYFVKYGEYLQEGETLDSVVATLDVEGELNVVGPVVMPSNTDIEFWLEGGVAGVTYKLELTATTSYGNVKQDEIKVKIKEI